LIVRLRTCKPRDLVEGGVLTVLLGQDDHDLRLSTGNRNIDQAVTFSALQKLARTIDWIEDHDPPLAALSAVHGRDLDALQVLGSQHVP